MTITLHKAVYDGLFRKVGKCRISKFIEELVRLHVMNTSLDEHYQAMAADKAREAEASDWCNALARDMTNTTR